MGINDYINVIDLSRARVYTLKAIKGNCSLEIFYIGTGKDTSVLELVPEFKKVTGVEVPYKIVGRRTGAIATCFADATEVKEKLLWIVKYDVEDMFRDD